MKLQCGVLGLDGLPDSFLNSDEVSDNYVSRKGAFSGNYQLDSRYRRSYKGRTWKYLNIHCIP